MMLFTNVIFTSYKNKFYLSSTTSWLGFPLLIVYSLLYFKRNRVGAME